jgi:predicted amidophosphoribosyltransferase
MTGSPFGINVVSRSHVVVCRGCGTRARRVGAVCETCGADLAEGLFAITEAEPTAARRGLRERWRLRRDLRRAPAG